MLYVAVLAFPLLVAVASVAFVVTGQHWKWVSRYSSSAFGSFEHATFEHSN